MMRRLQRCAGDVLAGIVALIIIALVTTLILTDLLRSPGGQEIIDGIKEFKLLSNEADDREALRERLEIQVAHWADVKDGLRIYAATRFSSPDDLDAPVYGWCVLQEQTEIGRMRREIVIAQRMDTQKVEFAAITNSDAEAFGMSASGIEDAARQHCRFIG